MFDWVPCTTPFACCCPPPDDGSTARVHIIDGSSDANRSHHNTTPSTTSSSNNPIHVKQEQLIDGLKNHEDGSGIIHDTSTSNTPIHVKQEQLIDGLKNHEDRSGIIHDTSEKFDAADASLNTDDSHLPHQHSNPQTIMDTGSQAEVSDARLAKSITARKNWKKLGTPILAIQRLRGVTAEGENPIASHSETGTLGHQSHQSTSHVVPELKRGGEPLVSEHLNSERPHSTDGHLIGSTDKSIIDHSGNVDQIHSESGALGHESHRSTSHDVTELKRGDEQHDREHPNSELLKSDGHLNVNEHSNSEHPHSEGHRRFEEGDSKIADEVKEKALEMHTEEREEQHQNISHEKSLELPSHHTEQQPTHDHVVEDIIEKRDQHDSNFTRKEEGQTFGHDILGMSDSDMREYANDSTTHTTVLEQHHQKTSEENSGFFPHLTEEDNLKIDWDRLAKELATTDPSTADATSSILNTAG